jgi:hypothetical protein
MNGTDQRFRERDAELDCQANATEVRRTMLESLLAELDDQQVRDFIMGNERPEFEAEFEKSGNWASKTPPVARQTEDRRW